MKTSTFHSILPKSGKGVPSSEAQGAPDSTIVGSTHRQKNQIVQFSDYPHRTTVTPPALFSGPFLLAHLRVCELYSRFLPSGTPFCAIHSRIGLISSSVQIIFKINFIFFSYY